MPQMRATLAGQTFEHGFPGHLPEVPNRASDRCGETLQPPDSRLNQNRIVPGGATEFSSSEWECLTSTQSGQAHLETHLDRGYRYRNSGSGRRLGRCREPVEVDPSGVKRYFVEIDLPDQRSAGKMQFSVLVPVGQHAERSLPSVLVAPAGTNLMHGASLNKYDDYQKESLPYAEAGMIAVQYSLDGGLPDGMSESDPNRMKALADAYPKFASSGAGVANAMRAREFTLQKIKTAAPEKLYYAGHNLHLFLSLNSPQTKVTVIRCPVFVFHARDDSNVPFQHAQAFVDQLKESKTDVTFEIVRSGDHYQPMIDQGIPAAIRWIQSRSPSSR